MKRITLLLLLTLGLSLLLASLASAATRRATTIRVSGGEFFFKLSARTAPHGSLKFSFHNVGKVTHDFEIAGRHTPELAPGKSATLTVTLSKPGRYAYTCTVPGHAAAGMKGVLTVT